MERIPHGELATNLMTILNSGPTQFDSVFQKTLYETILGSSEQEATPQNLMELYERALEEACARYVRKFEDDKVKESEVYLFLSGISGRIFYADTCGCSREFTDELNALGGEE